MDWLQPPYLKTQTFLYNAYISFAVYEPFFTTYSVSVVKRVAHLQIYTIDNNPFLYIWNICPLLKALF